MRKIISGIFCLVLLVSGLLVAARTPALISPDEPSHVIRAYTLVSGEWRMHTPKEGSTSAWVDSALAGYLQIHRQRNWFQAGLEIGRESKPSDQAIAEAGKKTLGAVEPHTSMPAPGAALYPPTSYLPQALSLGLGKLFHWQASTAYFYARVFTLSASVAIWFLCFQIVAPSYLTLTLICLPMSIFQMASASIDGISNSLAILALSLYLSLPKTNGRKSHLYQLMMSIIMLLVVPARLHLWPLLLLPILAAYHLRTRASYLIGTIPTAAILAWVIHVSGSTINTQRDGISTEPIQVSLYFLSHPTNFIGLVINTLEDREQALFYGKSFLGILGRGVPLEPPQAYPFLTGLMISAFLLTVCWSVFMPKQILTYKRILLYCISLMSALSVFFFLLIAWTSNPLEAQIIQGIQGRYFLVPAIIIAMGISAHQRQLTRPVSLIAVYATGITAAIVGTFLILNTL